MVAGEAEKSQNVKQDRKRGPETDYDVQFLREKLCRLEKLLLQKEKYNNVKGTEVTVQDQKGATHTIPINQSVRNEEALRKQIHDIEYCAEDCIRQIADFEQKPLREEDFLKKDYYEHARKKLSTSELYRNLQIFDENRKYLYEESDSLPQTFQNKGRMKCQAKSHSCFGHYPHEKSKKQLTCGHTCTNSRKFNSCTCTCDEHENNLGFKSDRSKLNVSPETTNKQVPLKKTTCSCREVSLSSDDSDGSFYKWVHVPKDQLNETCSGNDEDVESESSSEDQTTCSEVSKCTCYCSRNYSHGESSEADSDQYYEKKTKKTKTERFRGGLDVISPKTRTLMKYDNNNLKEINSCSKATNAGVDNLKFVKVEELREGLERLKIRNRNLRDFLDTLQNPMHLMRKTSEANTICTRVSSCYTFDVARQTRSGLLTVVEVLKGKCRNKDAVIVALADELKTGNDTKMDVQYVEKDKILMQDKSLVWNGLIEEKDNGRKFTKKDSAIGFAIFLMILISHVKRSDMISYLSVAKKILTESPFKLGLFINKAESFSIDFISTYYQDFAYSFRSFIKHSFDRWVNIVVQCSQWFDSYYAYFKKHLDDVNNFFVTNQSFILSSVCVILLGTLLIHFKKIWSHIIGLFSITECRKIYTLAKSTIVKLTKIIKLFRLRILSPKIFWFTLGFCSHLLWNLVHTDFYRLLDLFKIYHIQNAEHSLFQHLNETQEITVNDCKLFDTFDYSWLASIFCNKYQSFVQFAYYIIKNI